MRNLLFIFLVTCTLSACGQQQYVTETNIHYYPDSVNKKDSYISSQCTLDIYYPKGVKNFATVVWFHGGGLTAGDKETPKALTEHGFAVIGVGYRLSPKVKAPAYIEDAAAAVAWTFQHIASYGGNTNLIFLSGHSAGAYLDLMITMNKKYLAKYHIDANDVAELIPLSPQCITHFTVRQENGIKETQPVIDEYAPLYYVKKDMPPMLILTGDRELELLGRYEENAYFLRMLKLNGNTTTRLLELQGYDHGGMPVGAIPLLVKEVLATTKEIKAKKGL